MDLVTRYSLKVKLNKLEHESVFIQAHLCELMNQEGATLVEGSCTVYGDSCYHVWIEDKDGRVTDVTRKLFKEFDVPDFKLSRDMAPGLQKDQKTADLFELYRDEPKEFWKKASKKFLDFRSKCRAQISKTGSL
jgi:hypothetical protein